MSTPMNDLFFIFILLVVYLIAAIPTGIVLSRLMGSEDIREKGSGNIGATNVYRVAGKLAGVLTLVGDALKGLVISNMMASIPEYNRYAEEVLIPQIDPQVMAEIEALEAAEDYENPRYMELLMEHHYAHHILRRPVDQWPEKVLASLEHVNPAIYVLMQGPSELGASGRIENWDRTADLAQIETLTLVIGARYDTMDPAHMEWMAGELPKGEYLFCPNAAHVAYHDDTEIYMEGLIRFLEAVDAGD